MMNILKDVTAQIPSWLTEGRKELSDNRSIWDWLKYNIRVQFVTQHSKRRAKEKKN